MVGLPPWQKILLPGQVVTKHAPMLQREPAGQDRPHAPQFSVSVARSTQVEPHAVWPVLQVNAVVTHVPAEHV